MVSHSANGSKGQELQGDEGKGCEDLLRGWGLLEWEAGGSGCLLPAEWHIAGPRPGELPGSGGWPRCQPVQDKTEQCHAQGPRGHNHLGREDSPGVFSRPALPGVGAWSSEWLTRRSGPSRAPGSSAWPAGEEAISASTSRSFRITWGEKRRMMDKDPHPALWLRTDSCLQGHQEGDRPLRAAWLTALSAQRLLQRRQTQENTGRQLTAGSGGRRWGQLF